MIRNTLAHTKSCTYSIHLNDPNLQGMRRLHGTGFFVSAEGHFVTAAHVVMSGDALHPLLNGILVMGEGEGRDQKSYQGLIPLHVDRQTDFALLKLDPSSFWFHWYLDGNKMPNPLGGMPFLQISIRELEDGEPVYSYGYPLPFSTPLFYMPMPDGSVFPVARGEKRLPRTTSAIIAGRDELPSPDGSGLFLSAYVIDKALNFGNSGGPVVRAETGQVFAFCHGFQTMDLPQMRLTIDSTTMAVKRADPKDGPNAAPVPIQMPSLYSFVPFLGQPSIRDKLREHGVPLADD